MTAMLAGATWPTQTSKTAVPRTPRKLIRSCITVPFRLVTIVLLDAGRLDASKGDRGCHGKLQECSRA
jgi:hypothetical protein